MSLIMASMRRCRNAWSSVTFMPEGPVERERGDVPGWVLVTLMTAGLVTLLWQTAGPLLKTMFTSAMSSVSGG